VPASVDRLGLEIAYRLGQLQSASTVGWLVHKLAVQVWVPNVDSWEFRKQGLVDKEPQQEQQLVEADKRPVQ